MCVKRNTSMAEKRSEGGSREGGESSFFQFSKLRSLPLFSSLSLTLRSYLLYRTFKSSNLLCLPWGQMAPVRPSLQASPAGPGAPLRPRCRPDLRPPERVKISSYNMMFKERAAFIYNQHQMHMLTIRILIPVILNQEANKCRHPFIY